MMKEKNFRRIDWKRALRRFAPLLVAVAALALGNLASRRAASRPSGDEIAQTAAHAPQPSGAKPSTDPQKAPALRLIPYSDQTAPGTAQNDAVGIVGSRLPRPLRAQALDADGKPISGLEIHVFVISPDAPPDQPETTGVTIYPSGPLRTDKDGIVSLDTVFIESVGENFIVFSAYPDGEQPQGRVVFRVEGRSKSWFNWTVMVLIGGMALFLLGAKLTGEGLGRLGGAHLREWMNALEGRPVTGVALGAAATFLMQSSTASTTMFVTFAGANRMTLRQAIPLVLGSAIGTSLTVQLLAFNLYDVALVAVSAGVLLQIISTERMRMRWLGSGLLGFGLLFHGMHVMIQAVDPLRRLPWLADALWAIRDYPGWTLILAALFTATVHSSAATLGLALALARQNLITPEAAVPIIFGANIGTTVTAMIASTTMSREARRVAVSNIVFKILGVLLFLPLMRPLAWIGVWVTALATGGEMEALTSSETARALANIHTIFNICIATIAVLCLGHLEKLVMRLVPKRSEEGAEAGLKYLDLPMVESPRIVLGAALREVSRMGRFVEEQMKAAREALFKASDSQLDFVHKRDDKLDAVHRDVSRYLIHMMRQPNMEPEAGRFLSLIQIVNHIEHIGDLLDKNIAPLASKRILYGTRFSPEGGKELDDLFLRVANDLSALFIAIATTDQETLAAIRRHRSELDDYARSLLVAHLHRLQEGSRDSLDTSSIHVDLINYLLRIEFHISHIAGLAIEMSRENGEAAKQTT